MEYRYIIRPIRQIDFMAEWQGDLYRSNGRPVFEEEDIIKDCDVIVEVDGLRYEIESAGDGHFFVTEIGGQGYHDHVDSPSFTLNFDTDEEALDFVDKFDALRLGLWAVDFVYDEHDREIYAV